MYWLFIWWHEAILSHRVKGSSGSTDNRGLFYMRRCSCGKDWVVPDR